MLQSRRLTISHSADLGKRQKREAKSGNKFGKPIVLKSKIAAAVLDPNSPSTSVFIAESAGSVRKVNIDVSIARNTIWSHPLETLISSTG